MMERVVIIAGPTAVGKTKYAIGAAKELGGEIVSADSMQLYKYMDIGSAKPDKAELSQAPHHLIGEIDPREPFSAARYQKLAKAAIAGILARGRLPVISGGTGLYINSLIYDMDFTAPPAENGYRAGLFRLAAEKGNAYIHARLAEKDPDAAERIHPNNLKRMIRALEVVENTGRRIMPFDGPIAGTKDYEIDMVCLNRDRQELYGRINDRVDKIIDKGLVSEVKSLIEMGLGAEDISMKGIGYKEVIAHLEGEYDIAEAVSLIKRNTRRYAKRQITWFRRYEGVKWFNLSEFKDDSEGMGAVIGWLNEKK